MARKPVYQRGEVMSAPETDWFLVKGNLSAEEFNEIERNYGEDPSSPESIRHGWIRCEQHGDNQGYNSILQPTESHARGAFEATWIER